MKSNENDKNVNCKCLDEKWIKINVMDVKANWSATDDKWSESKNMMQGQTDEPKP